MATVAVELSGRDNIDDIRVTWHVYNPLWDVIRGLNSSKDEYTVVFPVFELLTCPVTSMPLGLIQVISGVTDRAGCFVNIQETVYL